jgi:hypothetical protein
MHAHDAKRRAFCRSCRTQLAVEGGYCSEACAVHDGELQSIAF